MPTLPPIPIDFDTFWKNLWTNNPFFTTVFLGGAVTLVLAYFRKSLRFLYVKAREQVMVVAHFDGRDSTPFIFLQLYLADIKRLQKIRNVRPIMGQYRLWGKNDISPCSWTLSVLPRF